MINKPSTNELLEKIPDRYELISVVAARARELRGGSDKLTSFEHPNKLTIAANEIKENLLVPVENPTITEYFVEEPKTEEIVEEETEEVEESTEAVGAGEVNFDEEEVEEDEETSEDIEG